MQQPTGLVWFRNDLRLQDNPALAAASTGHRVAPIYIHSPEEEGHWASGAASRWWLHHSLSALNQSLLTNYDTPLLLFRGSTKEPAEEILVRLIKQTSASAIFFNRRYEPWAREQEQALSDRLSQAGVAVHAFHSNLLFAPETVRNKTGAPYKVFTPFWKSAMDIPWTVQWHNIPDHLERAEVGAQSLSLNELDLLPHIDWAQGIRAAWQPGEAGATKQLDWFLKGGGISNYRNGRDRPDLADVSRLSPHLHFGEINPRTIWLAVKQHALTHPADRNACGVYLKELGWREFAYHLLYHFPETVDQPLRQEFGRFPWSNDESLLASWQQGKTGFPIVDAGMRELWTTGWMHNRVRMVVASFLVKDLMISWRQGARWFWDTLVDADLANNTLGWQWSAGCGADAAPYFRIFNPLLQGEKFDPKGAYVRRWVPELAQVSDRWIHRPWMAPPLELAAAGVELGINYPRPIVEHGEARRRALAAFASIKAAPLPMTSR